MYVGITTKTVAHRWRQHVKDAGVRGYKFQRVIHKYGADAFSIEELYCYNERDDAINAEIELIAQLDLIKTGFNISLGGETSPTLNPEVAARGGATRRGRPKPPISDKARANMSAAQLLRFQSPEQREHIAAIQRGKKRGPRNQSTKDKISARFKGIPLTPEHRAKLSTAHAGKKRKPHSEETRIKIRQSNSVKLKGRKLSDAHVKAIGEASSKLWSDPEYKARQSASRKAS